MDKRTTPRVALGQTVTVTVYGNPDRSYPATVKDASERGLGIHLPVAVAHNAALCIRLDDAILLGEVLYCAEEGDHYRVGVQLEQMLSGLAELARALESYREEERATELGTEMAYAVHKRHRQDR